MSCEWCEKMRGLGSYPYRWGAATVEIIACEKHAKEIIAVLNNAQFGTMKERKGSHENL